MKRFKVGDKVVLKKNTNISGWNILFVKYLKERKYTIVNNIVDRHFYTGENNKFLISCSYFELYKQKRLKLKLP